MMGKDGEPLEDDSDIRNDLWFKENYLELIEDYPNQWIAVLDQRVVCSGISKGVAAEKAKEMLGDKKFSFYFIEPSDIMP
ncbi:MAG: DUF5678 domain-containing protein [Thermoplasmata archaeon]|jgi:hypothetical protein|nr:DUF5678 domain-containing protein [Thermoplasmata archaeon]